MCLRILVAVAATLVLGIASTVTSAGPVGAQVASPAADDEALPSGVTFEVLSTGSTDEFPATPADVQLYRVGLPAGTVLDLSPEPAFTIAYVEQGEVTMTVAGDVTVIRSPGPDGPEAVETIAAGEAFTLEVTDSVVIPLTASGGELRVDSREAASLLVVNLISFSAFEGEEATPSP